MKIEISKEEFRLLLDMAYLAEWMITAHDEEADPAKEKYEALAQKIYSHAEEFGFASLVEHWENDEYYPTRDFEEEGGVQEHIDAYDANSFWEELVNRLTEQDVDKIAESENKQFDSPEEYWKVAGPIAEKFSKEFEANGLSRLTIGGS